tara:strand:- start:17179 stop:17397 length:219 start_codon:yes stop_codon:yes gene_type:complete
VEEKLYEIITDTYGTVFEPAPETVKQGRLVASKEGLDKALSIFISNPSAENYNILTLAMLTYQYWVQKKVIE